MEIRTQRLLLRPFIDADQSTMLRLLTDTKIKETFMIPDFDDKEQVIRLFRRYQELSLSDKRIAGAIETEGQLIGFFNDTGIQNSNIELGYVIDPAFHNQGYMTEALKVL
ncbi:MAG: GNAT family N-acetyltransferase, partial [Oscillospiraceae bacterium]|nr:GNAT family N-acetyltransferase [Oscillospiraceae bacterium]